jgi:nucleotide-binding universal stress UspA family protein
MSRVLLDEQVKDVEDAGGTVAEIHLRGEQPAERIVALAEELGTYLMVVWSRGRGGIRRVLTGSVFDRVIHHARRPVVVVRSPKSSDGRVRSLRSLLTRFGASKKASAQR